MSTTGSRRGSGTISPQPWKPSRNCRSSRRRWAKSTSGWWMKAQSQRWSLLIFMGSCTSRWQSKDGRQRHLSYPAKVRLWKGLLEAGAEFNQPTAALPMAPAPRQPLKMSNKSVLFLLGLFYFNFWPEQINELFAFFNPSLMLLNRFKITIPPISLSRPRP